MTFDLNGPIRDYEERMIYVFGGRVDHNNNMIIKFLFFRGFSRIITLPRTALAVPIMVKGQNQPIFSIPWNSAKVQQAFFLFLLQKI